MRDEITDALRAYESAIEDDDYAAAKRHLERLNELYEGGITTEDVLTERALLARDQQGGSSEGRTDLHEFAQYSSATALTRTSFLTTAAAYLSDPDEVDRGQVLEVTDTLRTRERELGDRADDVEDALEGITLPPAVELLAVDTPAGPHLKGGTLQLHVVAANAGDGPAESVAVAVTDPDGVSVSPVSVDLGSLDGGSVETVAVDASLDAAGRYSVDVDLSSASAGTSAETATFTVADKTDIVDDVGSSLEELARLVESADEVPAGLRRSLAAKVDTAEKKVDDAHEFAEKDRAKQANNALDAASKALGALLNQVHGTGNGGNGGLPDLFELRIVNLTERLIDLLTAAREAEL